MASRSHQSLMAASSLRRQNSSLWPYLNDSPSHQMHVWRRAAQSHGRRRCAPSYATVDGRVDGSRVAERASRVRDEQACVSRRGGRTHAVVSSESTTRSECFPCSREAIDKLSAAPHRLAIGKRSFAAFKNSSRPMACTSTKVMHRADSYPYVGSPSSGSSSTESTPQMRPSVSTYTCAHGRGRGMRSGQAIHGPAGGRQHSVQSYV